MCLPLRLASIMDANYAKTSTGTPESQNDRHNLIEKVRQTKGESSRPSLNKPVNYRKRGGNGAVA